MMFLRSAKRTFLLPPSPRQQRVAQVIKQLIKLLEVERGEAVKILESVNPPYKLWIVVITLRNVAKPSFL